MIFAAVLLATALAMSSVEVTLVVGEDLPQTVDVARLTRPAPSDAWRLVDVHQRAVASGRVVVSGAPGDDTLIVVRAPGRPGYLLYGPVRWPSNPATYRVSRVWRRTVRGHDPSRGTLLWVSPATASTEVLCEWSIDVEWECLGVPRSISGVIVRAGPTGIFYSVVRSAGPRNDVEDLSTAFASWGRLLVVQNLPAGGAHSISVRALRLYRPASRPHSVRFDVMPDGRVHVDQIAPGALWVTGDGAASGSWIDIVAAGVGAGRTAIEQIVGGRPDAVVPVEIESAMAVSGRVMSGLAEPVEGAIVGLYRLGEELKGKDGRESRRQRIAVSEQHTNAEGEFEFPDLTPERYELLVLHPQFGRAVQQIEPHAPEVRISLKPPPAVIGRVVQRGVAKPGVPVEFVPALEAFAAAEDVTELRGGEDSTDADGRFRVFAAAGPGELRIGTRESGIKRVAMPASDARSPVTDVGDIELGSGTILKIVFEDPRDCQPVLTGPLGSARLSIVRAERGGPAMFSATLPEPGRWSLVAMCGDRERILEPPAIEVSPDQPETTIVLRWPEYPTPPHP